MNSHPKIQPFHLERQAQAYIRQSTSWQVEHNLESQDLQYQLGQRAQALGWCPEQVVIIDEDLGKSGVSSSDRPGFQALVAAVGLGQVGIILVTDVSRLARNCSDWYQLLDLATVYGTLIGDASAVYDPRDYNDRLLLGLKGTFSEVQWYTMRTQMYQALLNKARRGEYRVRLPVGLEWQADGQIGFAPDQEIQTAIKLVFKQFEQRGSARAVLLYCRQHNLELPRCIQSGPDKGQIKWVKASYQAIYRILTHPAYAGAYTYGKRTSQQLPGGKVEIQRRDRQDWEVCIQDAFVGYISWAQYLGNQEQLRQNGQSLAWNKGVPRSGLALLQGLVLCGRCGRRLHSRYSRQPAYVCEQAHKAYGDPLCQTFMVPHIDLAVTQVFLEAVQPAHLEAALATLEQIKEERQRLAARWQQRLERAGYETELARRRYERVDPDNRLVAAELERYWEDKLQTWQQLESEWQQVQTTTVVPLSEADKKLIRQLAVDIPALWQAETTSLTNRKRLLRCLIQDVTLDADTKPGFSLIRIHWHTGAVTMVEVERPKPGCRTDRTVVERIRQLARHHPDDQIATILNEAGLRTATNLGWNRRRVQGVRKNHSIPTACPYVTPKPGPRGDGLIASKEAGARLGVSRSMVAYWYRQGRLVGHQRQPGTALWVRLTDDELQRLDGSSCWQPQMEPLTDVVRTLDLNVEQLRTEIEVGRLLPYRLWIKNQWYWFVIRSEVQHHLSGEDIDQNQSGDFDA
jgi:DNA invertase Pin-like site-specific DNA recombinase